MNWRTTLPIPLATIVALLGVLLFFTHASSAQEANRDEASIAIDVRVRGTTGEEIIELWVDGEKTTDWTLSTGYQTLTHDHDQSIVDGSIRVVFTNDGRTADGDDRNVILDYITVDGKTYDTKDPSVYSTGIWSPDNGCGPGYKQSRWLVCDGYVEYQVEPVSLDHPIDLRVRGTTGEEIIEVEADGVVLGQAELTTGYDDLRFIATGASPTTVRVTFTNDGRAADGGDRNVILDYIVANGQTFQTEAPTVWSTGTWTPDNGCGPGFKEHYWLTCDGYFEFEVGDDGPSTDPDYSCNGHPTVEITAPAADLAAMVEDAPEGTCFLLRNGQYRFGSVTPKDGMRFVGESRDGVVVDGDGYEHGFSGNATGVVIQNFTMHNFNFSDTYVRNGETRPIKRQEQSPIRGTVGIWATAEDWQRADEWVVEGMHIHDNYAAGIFMGDNWIVRDNLLVGNGTTGVAGNLIIGGLIENNEIIGNGYSEEGGAGVNGGGIKVTKVNGVPNTLTIRNNQLLNNKRGIWCDVGCTGVLIEDNSVDPGTNGGNSGIIYEISMNAVIRNNTVIGGNYAGWTHPWPTGAIIVAESADVVVEDNRITDAASAITVRQVGRPAAGEDWLQRQTRPEITYITENVTIRNNIIENSRSVGASDGVGGDGQMVYDTIEFSGNTYQNADDMDFWWKRQPLTFAEWTAAGRR